MRPSLPLLAAASILLVTGVAEANTIMVGPGDDYTKIEAAQPGDTVLIAPGTYQFRVYLSQTGTAAMPITIRAADPTHPPVWDLDGMVVNQWPGSYTGGDNDRGCWQVVGAYYVIESIVFQNCHNGIDAAGIRTNASTSLRVRDVLIQNSDDGFTGAGDDTAVEFSEIANNGDPTASQETHNIYIYGGSFALRYSYVHDSTHGQNFHIRAQTAVLEYNWIARAQNYEGDMMPGSTPGTQSLTLRGNVILGKANPEKGGEVIALYNDSGTNGWTFDFTALWNTIVVGSSGNPALVNVANDGLDAASVTLSNNVLVGTTSLIGLSAPTMNNVTIAGTNNWIPTGATPGGLAGSIVGSSPGFNDAANLDFTLASGSTAIGAASPVAGAPTDEYFQNQTVKERFRCRASAHDLGAFEHDTMGASYGPYDTAPASCAAGAGGSGAGGEPATTSAATGSSSGSSHGAGGASASSSSGSTSGSPVAKSGCSCRTASARDEAPAAMAALALLMGLARRRPKALRACS